MAEYKSNSKCNRVWTGWLWGSALLAGAVTAFSIYRHYQKKYVQPEFRAERAYQRGLKQALNVEERIPRWLAERS